MTVIREIMTEQAMWLPETATVAEAAKLMRDQEIGCVPIGKDDKLVGMVTDRDIVTRAVAEGLDMASTPVKSIMSERVLYCREDSDAEEVAANMGEVAVRRMPVVNRDKRLVGMISIGDIAASGSALCVGRALHDIVVA